MKRYLTLLNLTDQGLREVHESGKRAAAFRDAVESRGGRVISQYWAMGDIDGCVIFEAPDEVAAGSLLLSLGQAGDVRTHSTRLFDETEFTSMVARA